jgi:hypothetical protein
MVCHKNSRASENHCFKWSCFHTPHGWSIVCHTYVTSLRISCVAVWKQLHLKQWFANMRHKGSWERIRSVPTSTPYYPYQKDGRANHGILMQCIGRCLINCVMPSVSWEVYSCSADQEIFPFFAKFGNPLPRSKWPSRHSNFTQWI